MEQIGVGKDGKNVEDLALHVRGKNQVQRWLEEVHFSMENVEVEGLYSQRILAVHQHTHKHSVPPQFVCITGIE